MIPHLVEVWAEYEEKGLVMLALSGEASSVVEHYVEKNGVTYPTGSGSRSSQSYKVSGIPKAFLIDHTGKIIWSGHPNTNVWVDMLDKALAEANGTGDSWNPGERPAHLKKAVALAKKGTLGKAWNESETLKRKFVEEPGKMESIQKFQEDFLLHAKAITTSLDGYYARGVYFEASEFLNAQMKVFKGSPPTAEWKVMLKSWSKDSEIKTLMDLDKKRIKAMDLAWNGKADKARDALSKLRKKAKGLVIFAEIQSNLEAVSKM